MSQYDNPVSATVNGVLDLFRRRPEIGQLTAEDRLDGLSCLITGANSGLGLATALQLAERGARLILACRSPADEAIAQIRKQSPNCELRDIRLDLADLQSVQACCDELAAAGERLDRVILNAGLVPKTAQRSAQGFEMMFAVHYLGHMALVQGLLENGCIPNHRFTDSGATADAQRPRIIFVSSESHRSGHPIKAENFGQFVDYSAMGSIAQYGHSKRVLCAYVNELSQRLQGDVAVHALCPGPIHSNIAREAPPLARPALNAVMKMLFASPAKAARPVVFLACSQAIEDRSGIYLHLMSEKQMDAQTQEPAIRDLVWNQGQQWIAHYRQKEA